MPDTLHILKSQINQIILFDLCFIHVGLENVAITFKKWLLKFERKQFDDHLLIKDWSLYICDHSLN